ncbi:TPA: hypothetical protein DEG21_01835 [Patescibacteria group bacterium]|nr:hypothetical protein [Candidatus Gracilibacteria bacterium]HBY74628.1 hypothetical protein [Candidatus Gracilibacteria bacterium]
MDERRLNEESNPLALDSTSLIRAFKEKVNCVMLIGDFARRFAHLCNQESSSYHFKKPKME